MSARRLRLGWYAHHHGAGHTSRLFAISRELDADIVAFSSAPPPPALGEHVEWVALDRDDTASMDARRGGDPHQNSPDANGLLHWAPLRHRGHRSRLAHIARRIETDDFDAFVVDVSAEVTLFVRLLGVPTVVVTQPGDRCDRTHQSALRAADAVIAPWPGELYQPSWLTAATGRTHFVGGIARFAGRERTAARVTDTVLMMAGAGGSAIDRSALDRAAVATPDRRWQTAGLGTRASGAWLDDPFDALCRAGVVVSWAGQNAITDLAAADARAIVIAQERPFGEQTATAAVLAAARLAVVLPSWPRDGEWPELLRRAAELRPDWSQWQIDGAATRAAMVIERVANGLAVAEDNSHGAPNVNAPHHAGSQAAAS